MQLGEMTEMLEAIARDENVAPSARVRALEVLMRLDKQHPASEDEWAAIVAEFGATDAD